MRFSSDTGPTDPDLGSTLGIGLKLFGVPGENMLGEVGGTADLIMQAASRFFVDDAQQMVEFTYAGVVQRNYNAYLATHKAKIGTASCGESVCQYVKISVVAVSLKKKK